MALPAVRVIACLDPVSLGIHRQGTSGDEHRILPVSVLLDGQYGQHNVYASVPAVLGADGVEQIIELNLTPEEQAQFDASCKTMQENFDLALTL